MKSHSRSQSAAVRVLGLLFSYVAPFSFVLCQDLTSCLSVQIMEEYKISSSQYSLLHSCAFIPSIFTSLLAGPAIERFGMAKTGLFLIGWCCILSFLFLATNNYASFVAFRLIYCLFAESFWSIQNLGVSTFSPSKILPFLFSVSVSFATLPSVLAMNVYPLIVGDGSVKRAFYLLIGFNWAVLALCLPILWAERNFKPSASNESETVVEEAFLEPVDEEIDRYNEIVELDGSNKEDADDSMVQDLPPEIFEEAREKRSEWIKRQCRKLFVWPISIYLIMTSYVINSGINAFNGISVNFLVNYHGIESLEASTWVSYGPLAAACFAPVAGAIIGAIGMRPILLTILHLSCVTAFLLLSMKGIPPLIAIIILGCCQGAGGSLTSGCVTLLVPFNRVGSAYAFLVEAMSIGLVLIPQLSTAVGNAVGLIGVVYTMLAFNAVGTINAILLTIYDFKNNRVLSMIDLKQEFTGAHVPKKIAAENNTYEA